MYKASKIIDYAIIIQIDWSFFDGTVHLCSISDTYLTEQIDNKIAD